MSPGAHRLLGSVLLATLTLLAYRSTWNHEFLNFWDDPNHVVENRVVLEGLHWDGVVWAFGSLETGNWHPLTWLSHMLDVELYGLEPRGHHQTSALLHALATLLVFQALLELMRASRSRDPVPIPPRMVWRCALVAAVFGLHPLRVESVAWISERKDVLSGVFCFATLYAYAGFVRHRTAVRYACTVLFYVAGLLSKSMLITLPLLLLVIDFWPLGRFRVGPGEKAPWRTAVSEKLPLLGLAAAAGSIALLAQVRAHATLSLEEFALAPRIATALLTYFSILEKSLVPTHLAAFYPHPAIAEPDGEWLWRAGLAGLVLAALAGFALRVRHRYPYWLAGLLWYGIALMPVSGIIRIGAHAWADRYSYLPMLGPTLALVWGAADLIRPARRKWPKGVSAAALGISALLLCGLIILTDHQARTWSDSETLWSHAREVVPRNYKASLFLGMTYAKQGRTADALRLFKEALAIAPGVPAVHAQLGFYYMRERDLESAAPHLEIAEAGFPNEARIQLALALVEMARGDRTRAAERFERAVRLDPELESRRTVVLGGKGNTRRGPAAEAGNPESPPP